MTSRERVKRAVHFQGPDHVPHYLPDGGRTTFAGCGPPGPIICSPGPSWRVSAAGEWTCGELSGSQ